MLAISGIVYSVPVSALVDNATITQISKLNNIKKYKITNNTDKVSISKEVSVKSSFVDSKYNDISELVPKGKVYYTIYDIGNASIQIYIPEIQGYSFSYLKVNGQKVNANQYESVILGLNSKEKDTIELEYVYRRNITGKSSFIENGATVSSKYLSMVAADKLINNKIVLLGKTNSALSDETVFFNLEPDASLAKQIIRASSRGEFYTLRVIESAMSKTANELEKNFYKNNSKWIMGTFNMNMAVKGDSNKINISNKHSAKMQIYTDKQINKTLYLYRMVRDKNSDLKNIEYVGATYNSSVEEGIFIPQAFSGDDFVISTEFIDVTQSNNILNNKDKLDDKDLQEIIEDIKDIESGKAQVNQTINKIESTDKKTKGFLVDLFDDLSELNKMSENVDYVVFAGFGLAAIGGLGLLFSQIKNISKLREK